MNASVIKSRILTAEHHGETRIKMNQTPEHHLEQHPNLGLKMVMKV